jgi:protoheme IX farnesyltransferase
VKSAVLEQAQPVELTRPRIAEYLQLARPRIGAMALFTVAVGYLLAAGSDARLVPLLHTLVGAGLVAAGASALNQWLERKSDARMRRTANRPLPAGRLHPAEALGLGIALGIAGVAYLLNALPSPAAAFVAAITFLTYVFVYTPLKPITAWNTVVGAFPGALPPVIGWCAARGTLSFDAVTLFLILFVWQLPHFFAIAWLYRDDYAAGGLRMIPIADPAGTFTARAMIGTCLLLLPVTMLPALVGQAGPMFLTGAIFLSVLFLNCAIEFRKAPTRINAKYVLRSSLLYLTGLMLLLVGDGVVPRLLGR